MAVITHLFDTSAILAHYFDEPGADEVYQLFQTRSCRLAISVLTIPELKTRLLEESDDPTESDRASDLYINVLTGHVAVTKPIAGLAARIRESTPQRLPLVDAVIAACAAHQNCILVHRDPYMSAIPEDFVHQMVFADK